MIRVSCRGVPHIDKYVYVTRPAKEGLRTYVDGEAPDQPAYPRNVVLDTLTGVSATQVRLRGGTLSA